MRLPALLAAAAIAVAVAVAPAPAANAAQSCPPAVAKLTKLTKAVANGLDVTACGVPKTVAVDGLEVAIPAPGNGLIAVAIDGAGSESTLIVETDAEGVVSVTTEDHADTTAPKASAAAVTRCSDNATHLQGVKWYTTPTLRVNTGERRPSNISSSTWSTVVSQSWSVVRNGYNSCGLTRSLAVPGSLLKGSVVDANMSGNTCTTPDKYNVVDFGNLGGTTAGLTCVAYQTRTGHDKIITADVRLDNTSRAWVTSVSGCSGARWDVRSVLTHELGHWVGLSHAAERGGNDLTMSPTITSCNASARTFGSGDLFSLYALYPRG
jgi:hypothetical protein